MVTTFCHTHPDYVRVTCLIASNSLWLMWKLVFFFFSLGSDSSKKKIIKKNRGPLTVHWQRHLDEHRYTEQIQRDRNREEKGRGTEADFERRACRQITVTLGRWQYLKKSRSSMANLLDNIDVTSKLSHPQKYIWLTVISLFIHWDLDKQERKKKKKPNR